MTDTPDTAAPSAISSLSFEAAMGELETIVRRLESGDVSLEESVTLYERGHALRGHGGHQETFPLRRRRERRTTR